MRYAYTVSVPFCPVSSGIWSVQIGSELKRTTGFKLTAIIVRCCRARGQRIAVGSALRDLKTVILRMLRPYAERRLD